MTAAKLAALLHRHRGRLALTLALAAAVAGCTVLVADRMPVAADTVVVADADFGPGEEPEVRRDGNVLAVRDGLAVQPDAEAELVFTFGAPGPRRALSARAFIYVPAGGAVDVAARDADGVVRDLAPALRRPGEVVAVGELRPPVRIRVRARNTTGQPVLVLDKLTLLQVPPRAATRASTPLVVAWCALLALFVLAGAAALRRHAAVVAVVVAAAAVLWPGVRGRALDPVPPAASDLWQAARGASWWGLEDGLVSGAWVGLSHLSVQVAHLLMPLTGTGLDGVRSAGALAGVLAAGCVAWLGGRVGGPVTAVVAGGLVVALDAARDAALVDVSFGVGLIAVVVLLAALHRLLAEPTAVSGALAGAAAGVAVLAEPAWLPVAVVLVAGWVAAGPRTGRLQRVGWTAVAFCAVLAPSRIALVQPADGGLFDDVEARLPGGDAASRALAALHDALDALSARPDTGLLALVAFVAGCAGAAYLLAVPRLRRLGVLGLALAACTAGAGVSSSLAAAAAVLAVGAGTLAYALRRVRRLPA